MNVIPTRIHAYLDFIFGVLLIASPLVLYRSPDPDASLILIILGCTTIIYSLFTNYELGIGTIIPMKLHFVLDLTSAIILGSSPWLFGFAHYVWLPHVVFAAIQAAVVFLSVSKSPGWRERASE
jgi:hypothetical protein